MQDRIPTPGQEGRVLITPEDGSAPFYATVAMADNPTNPGTPLNKANLLQDSTEVEIFGNANNRTVDEAFSGIMDKLSLVMQNVANMTLTVTDTDGTPLEGVLVNGVFDENGETVQSNASGQAIGYVADGTTELSISGYADIENWSEMFSAVKGQNYTKVVEVTTKNFIRITSTQNIRFSGNVETIDVNAVGGGGGAGRSNFTNFGAYHGVVIGGAGGGGHSIISNEIQITPNTLYEAIVGAGGSPAARGLDTVGGTGGTSSFAGVTATGGEGGESGNPTATEPTWQGGAGNGNGANGQGTGFPGGSPGVAGGNGTQNGFLSFSQSGPMGGGGGSGSIGDLNNPSRAGGAGGVPYGGDGGSSYGGTQKDGQPGQDGYGGGGGSPGAELNYNAETYNCGDPARGGSGCIAIRMHLKSAA